MGKILLYKETLLAEKIIMRYVQREFLPDFKTRESPAWTPFWTRRVLFV
jgi:hypothetical protein